MNYLNYLDWIVIGLYFTILLGIILWSIKRKNRTSADYFLAGREIGWFVVGASIFASNIGSEHLVGLAGAGAATGMVMGHWELHAWVILLLGWVFVPFYIRSGVFTMPEFLERRYDSRSRWFLSIISLVGYVFTKVSVTVFAGAIVFETLMGLNFWTGALLVLLITGLYTIIGGMRSVVYTEAMQTIVLLMGSFVLLALGLIKIGGWNNLHTIAGSDHFNMWKKLSDPNFPWLGIALGTPIIGFWYFCTDQYIVQRTLAARSITQARRGTIFGAYLKLTVVFIFMVPGLIAYALAKTGQIDLTSSNAAFPTLVLTLLPAGLRGLMAASLLAALMSSLAAVFNSCSTLFTVDVYKKLKPESTEKHLITVGRIATIVVTILGVAWIPFMKIISDQLYKYLQSVQSYLAPPIAAVFLLGIFSKRINATGSIAALASGFVLGMLRLFLELNKDKLGGILFQIANLNFLYFCFSLFAVSILIMIIVSLLTGKPDQLKIKGLTYNTLSAETKAETKKSWNRWDFVHTVIIIAIIVSILIYFTG